jgi:hypothetical protein
MSIDKVMGGRVGNQMLGREWAETTSNLVTHAIPECGTSTS